MTEPDLLRIEARLGTPVPAAYRRFVLDTPPAGWESLGVVSGRVPRVVRWNRAVRRHPERYPVRAADGSRRPWPADWFVVGDNGGCDHYFVHADGSDPGLWHWDHAAKDVYRVGPTLAAAVADVREVREEGQSLDPPPPPPEPVAHPTLGDLLWHPPGRHSSGHWSGTAHTADGRAVALALSPYDTDRAAFLADAAVIVPQAVAAEPAAFAAALPDTRYALARQVPEEAAGLSDADLRAQLAWYQLDLSVSREGPKLKPARYLRYFYTGGEPFDWDTEDLCVGCRLARGRLVWTYTPVW